MTILLCISTNLLYEQIYPLSKAKKNNRFTVNFIMTQGNADDLRTIRHLTQYIQNVRLCFFSGRSSVLFWLYDSQKTCQWKTGCSSQSTRKVSAAPQLVLQNM